MRRMRDMAAVGGGGMDFFANQPEMLNLVVNTRHPLVQSLADTDNPGLAKQLIDLAMLSQNLLQGKELTDFIRRSVEMIKA
ncbi:MAG: hypothetical protein EAZ89_20885 [Bacteroidetes bacterium]|nr:MAG: hypothetical protein EAZ89_20885 [Bacteroidota bacterium]